MADIPDYEAQQIKEANASKLTPVVFIHGLWLLPSSWDRWRTVFEGAGYVTLAPGWPDDPNTGEDANRHPEVLAHKSVGQIADHFGDVIGQLKKKPALIGHSFGGLITQILAGRGLAAVSVAIDPAPFRGVLPLPVSTVKSSAPVIGNPANRGRAIPLTCDQFRFALANAVTEAEAHELYATFAVPGRRPQPRSAAPAVWKGASKWLFRAPGYAPNAWRCHYGTGISASTLFGGGLVAAERAALRGGGMRTQPARPL